MNDFRAFRILGNFAWPPLPGKVAAGKEKLFTPLDLTITRHGLIEIFYRDNNTAHRAIMRWTPKASDDFKRNFNGEASLPAGELENLWSLSHDDLTAKINNLNETDGIILNVSNPEGGGGITKGRRLIFQGATVLDQFDLKKPDSDEKALAPSQRRFALVRSAELSGEVHHSTVMFGQPMNRNFRFDLNVPVPVQPGDVSVDTNTARFSLVYSNAATMGSQGKFNTLTVHGQPVGARVPFAALTDKSLGSFGFAAATNSSAQRKYLMTLKPTAESWKKFWATGETLNAEKLFAKLGISTDAAPEQIYKNAAQRSFHFPSNFNGEDGQKYSVSSRVAFKLTNSEVKTLLLKRGAEWEPLFPGKTKFFFPRSGTKSVVTFDIFYEVELTDNAILRDVKATGSATMRVSLVWPEDISGKLGIKDKPKLKSWFTYSLHHAMLCMGESRADLQNLNTPNSVSFLPELSVEEEKQVVAALMRLEETEELERSSTGAPNWRLAEKDLDHGPILTILPKHRHLRSNLPDSPSFDFAEPLALKLRCYLPGFQANPSVKYIPNENDHHALALDHDPDVSTNIADQDDVEDGFFRLRLREVKHDAPRLSGQLGSLEFRRSAASKLLTESDQTNYSYLRLGTRADKREPKQTDVGKFENQAVYADQIAIDLRLRLAMDAVTPVIADGSNNAPILVPLGREKTEEKDEGKDATVTRYILEVTERLLDTRERNLTAKLFDRDEAKSVDAFALIGGQPWTVMGFSMESLGSRGTEAVSLVAEYDSATSDWSLNDEDALYQYELPPMATGESADKPTRLEVLDRGSDDKNPAPYPKDSYGLERYPIESRFGSSTSLWIDPEDRQKSSVPAPWDITNLFDRQQNAVLGVAFRGLEAEFLWGINAAVDPAITGRRSRVNTTEAVVGEPLTELSAAIHDPEIKGRWIDLQRSFGSRPYRLEVTEANLADTSSYPLARFDEEVSFALRTTALHRPATGDVLEDIFDPNEIERGTTKRLRFHARGLSGGALWPVEQRNLLRALQRDPKSSGGSLEHIALSPIGGDADQQARFLKDQVSIISRTRAGFVERYRVEVIGRIACYWHRAKHVVVYERTVNPSAQFAPEIVPGQTRSRRPILRKVSEFIEVLQPVRAYPDTPDAPAKATGPLDAVRFNSVIINVDSSWSEDIGTWGWRIPLWNRHAAVAKPDVYARPDLAFITRSEGSENENTTAQECRNPEHMSFVADFTGGGANTELWPIRVGVDTRHGKAPGLEDASNIDGRKQSDKKGSNPRRASVTRTPLGARRFTALLAPSSKRTQLNAHRANKPIYVDLESVTFMRAQPTARPDISNAVTGLASYQPNVLEDIGYWADGDKAPSLLTGVEIEIEALKHLAGTKPSGGGGTWETEFKKRRDELRAKIRAVSFGDKLKGLIGNTNDLKGKLEAGRNLLSDPGSACAKLRAEADATVKGKELLVLDRLRSGKAVIKEKIGGLDDDTTKTQVATKLIAAVRDEIEPAFDRASQDVATVGSDVETARAIVGDVLKDWRTTVGATRNRIDDLNRQYDRTKPSSISRVRAFRDKLEGMLSGLSGDINIAVEEAAQRLSTEIGSIGDVLSATLAAELRRIAEFESTTTISVENASETAEKQLRLVNKRLGDFIKQIDEMVAKLEKANPSNDVGKAAVANAIEKLKGLKPNFTKVESKIKETLNALPSTTDGLAKAVKTLSTEAQKTLTKGAAEIQTHVIDGLKDIADVAVAIARSTALLFGRSVEIANDQIVIFSNAFEARLKEVFEETDTYVAIVHTKLDLFLDRMEKTELNVRLLIDDVAKNIVGKIKDLEDYLKPDNDDGLLGQMMDAIVDPAVKTVLTPFPDDLDFVTEKEKLQAAVDDLDAELTRQIKKFSGATLKLTNDIETACAQLGDNLQGLIDKLTDSKWAKDVQKIADDIEKKIAGLDLGLDPKELIKNIDAAASEIRDLTNNVAKAGALVETYKNKVIEQLGDIGKDGAEAVPGNLLALYSTVTSSPELAGLKANVDRIRNNLDALKDVIDTTEAEAMLDLLGDRLKALGISIPFKQFGEALIPKDVGADGITNYLKNLCGFDVSRLLPRAKIPGTLRDAVKISHDIDKKSKRAWVQVDVNFDLPGRETLFSFGPFQMDFVDTKLTAQVRIEASADSKEIEENGSARIDTNVEALVGGEKMVGVEKLAMTYSDKGGLEFELKPENIKINRILKFVQDALAGLFSDDIGGLEFVKEGGVPVGVEYAFKTPVLDSNAVTSGVQNIQIGNTIRLVAFPDFKLTNSFSFCTPEKPFIFSFFILGGTGYVLVDADYRPFDEQLTVLVTAGAGASASLAFAFGPVSGSVYITLSVLLKFRKLIGRSDSSDLTIGVSLVVAGKVDVCGIVSIFLMLGLDLLYRSDGRIDANGRLILKIRISRFFKIKVRTDVKYKLRGGKSETVTKTTTKVAADEGLKKKLDKYKNAVSDL